MRQVGVTCVLAWMVVLAGGCESFAPAGSHANLNIAATDAQRLGYASGWASSIGLRGRQQIRSVAVLEDMIVFVEGPENFVTALSSRDGRFLWRELIGGPADILYGPYRNGNEVYVNSETQFFKLNAETGKLMEIQTLDHPVRSAAAITGELAIFGGANGRIFAHQIPAGYAKWQYELTSQIRVAPVLTTVDAFAVDSGGVYAMVQTDGGQLSWRGRTHGAVNGQPVVNRFSVLLPCDDGTLYALDRSTGRDQWLFRTRHPLRTTPIGIDNQVFLLIPEGTVAIDATSGRKLWERPDGAKPVLRRGTQLLLSTGEGVALADLDTGKTVDEAPTRPLRTILVGENESVLLVSLKGDVQQLTPRK